MRNIIRRILRESIQKSRYVLRRVKSLDTKNLIDLLKKTSIREMNRNKSIEDAILFASRSVTMELTPWHNENGYEFPEEDYDEATTYFGHYLQETFGNEIREYLQKVLPESSFNEDEFNYIFWKHSEVNGGSGFSNSYPSWGKLIIGRGWWFPINWWEIKENLDSRSKLTFMKPGDEHNNFGYYFSIIKKRKNLNESVIRILREEKEKITCEECGWSWKLSEGGEDPYTCHKCGNDNEKSDLIVFHGTPEKHEFNKEGYLFNGTFFSTDKNEAKSFGEYVYKVKMNPNLDLFDTNKLEDCEDIVNSFDLIDPYYDEDEKGYYIETPEQLWDNEDSWSPLERTPGVIEYLNRNYDGVWIYEGGVRNLLLFKPIKDKIEYVKLI